MSGFKLTEKNERQIKNRLEEIKKELMKHAADIGDYQNILDSLKLEREILLCEEAVLYEALRRFK